MLIYIYQLKLRWPIGLLPVEIESDITRHNVLAGWHANFFIFC